MRFRGFCRSSRACNIFIEKKMPLVVYDTIEANPLAGAGAIFPITLPEAVMFKALSRVACAMLLVSSIAVWGQSEKDDDKKGADKKEKLENTNNEKAEKEQKDPSKLYVDLSALLYLQWGYMTGFNYTGSTEWSKVYRHNINTSLYPTTFTAIPPYNYSDKNNDTFKVTRAYLTVKKRLGEYFSMKVTFDVDSSGANYAFLKYGFVQFQKDFGPVDINLQLGKIGTPVVGFIDNLNDLRWIGQNYIDNSKQICDGKTFDTSADFGASYHMNIMKLVTIGYSYTNGEGFKLSETYNGKAHTVLVSFNPEPYLNRHAYLNFYGRWEETDRNQLVTTSSGALDTYYRGIDRKDYLGFGLAWKSDLIKAGANCFFPTQYNARKIYPYYSLTLYPQTAGIAYMGRHKERFVLVDSWLNLDLGAITPAGVLILGRFAWAREFKGLLANSREEKNTLITAGGAGYRFNKNFRLAGYYEYIRYWSYRKLYYLNLKNPDPNHNVYIKAEVGF